MPEQYDVTYSETPINVVPYLRQFAEFLMGSEYDVSGFFGVIETTWYVWTVLAYLISFAFIYGIIYASIRTNQLDELETEHLKKQEELFQQTYGGGGEKNDKWQDILRHIESDNPNDWKLAIIEADIVLEDLLREHGYAGTTIGEKLKSASPQSFLTLDDAWAAHRTRNQIAHGDPDFVLTHKLARDAIHQYERVFTEFGYV